MSFDRAILRAQAKKKHKELMKGLAKSQRLPFNQVYETLVKMIKEEKSNPASAATLPSPPLDGSPIDVDISSITDMFAEIEVPDEVKETE